MVTKTMKKKTHPFPISDSKLGSPSLNTDLDTILYLELYTKHVQDFASALHINCNTKANLKPINYSVLRERWRN